MMMMMMTQMLTSYKYDVNMISYVRSPFIVKRLVAAATPSAPIEYYPAAAAVFNPLNCDDADRLLTVCALAYLFASQHVLPSV